MTKVINAFTARQNFGQILEEARFAGVRFLVERSGKPMVVVVGIDEWENIVETLAELKDKEYLDSIKQARKEIKLGKSVDFNTLQKILAKKKNVL